MKIDAILRNVVMVGVFAIPFIPLIVANHMFFPFITGKNFAFRIIIEITFAAWIILALRHAMYRPKFSWLLISVISFLGIITLADIFGANPFKSFWSNFERMEGLVTMYHLVAYFVVAGSVLNVASLWSRFWNTTVGVSVFMGFYGLFQLAGEIPISQGGVRLDGRFGNATYLGIYMLIHIFITLMLLARWRGHQSVRWIYGAIIILQFYNLYHTASRGPILGLMGGVILASLLIALFNKENKILRKIAVGAVLGVFLFVGLFFALKDTSFVRQSPTLGRFASISLTEEAKDARFIIWGMAWEGVKERPILGWGQENYNLIFNKYFDPRLHSQEPWFDRVHNVVLDWLVAGGILGALAYFSMYILTLFYMWFRSGEHLSITDKSILTGLLAAYTFHNLFVFDNVMSYIMFFSIMAYVYAMTAKEHSDEGFMNKEVDLGLVNKVVVPVIIIALAGTMYFVNVKGILAAHNLINALGNRNSTSLNDNLEFFKETLAYNSFGQQEVREQLAQTASRLANAEVDLQIKQDFLALASSELEKQAVQAPNDARHEIFLGTLLDSFRKSDEAQQHLIRAKELSPRKQTMFFQLALNRLNAGRPDEALPIFKEAFELEPEFKQARVFYALGAIHANRPDLVEELLIPEYGTVAIDDNRILSAYFETKQYDKVLEVWKLKVKNDPNNLQNNISLAAAYLQVGDRVGAVTQIKRAIEVDPNFKEQGDYFIREIEAGRTP